MAKAVVPTALNTEVRAAVTLICVYSATKRYGAKKIGDPYRGVLDASHGLPQSESCPADGGPTLVLYRLTRGHKAYKSVIALFGCYPLMLPHGLNYALTNHGRLVLTREARRVLAT